MDRSVQRTALATIARAGSQLVPTALIDIRCPDLAVAAAAQGTAIGILHFDQHLERLGDHLGLNAHWIAEPS